MQQVLYWVWLSLGLGIASPAAQLVLEKGLEPQSLYNMSLEQMIQMEIFSPKLCRKIKAQPLAKAEKICMRCQEKSDTIITAADKNYPQQLLALSDPPLVLYAKGNVPLLSQLHNLPVLTVVGTRKSSVYGARVAENMSLALSRAGFVIVSGLAVGIDAYAHYGALRAGKPTIAVLGCGTEVNYPVQNQQMRQKILESGGVLLSELEPDASPQPGYFPVRNRLLAGLAQGVLVVEAPERSGSLITAGHALAQGKDVFAVPSNIYDPKATGTLGLLRDGAIPAITPLDVAYPYFAPFAKWIQMEDLLRTAGRSVREQKPAPKDRQKKQEAKVTEKQSAGQSGAKDEARSLGEKQPSHEGQIQSVQPKPQEAPVQENPTENTIIKETLPHGYTRFAGENYAFEPEWQEEKKQLLEDYHRYLNELSEEKKGQKTIQKRKQETEKNSPSTIEHQEKETAEQSHFTPDILTEEQKKVYFALTKEPQNMTQLAAKCGMSIGELTAVLFEIGVPDPVRMYPGRLFSLS